MAALDNGGRTERGCACAKAQRYYDGWVEQASDNKLGENGSDFGGEGGPVQPDRVKAEKAAFYESLTACELRALGPWTIYFGFDKFNLTSEAQAVIDQIVADNAMSLSVVGNTDSSGSSAYNDALGQRRASAVSDALKSRGKAICSAVSDGESNLAVKTGDGVREPLNRRAVVAPCK